MKFEYIMSSSAICGFDEHNEYTVHALQSFFKDLEYDFSLLFNALVEVTDGKKLYNDYYNHVTNIFSDSGGLQIITRGFSKEKTEEIKPHIFKTQAQNSSVAMCFDDMPMEIIGESSSRLDLSNRFFIHEKIDEAAENTVNDLKKQIEIFDKFNTKTKIMVIAQGNCIDSYNKYLGKIVDSLTDDELEFIYGIAPSGASNGFGNIERFDMLYGLKELNIPEHIKKNIHLLGVGSASALLPLYASPDYFNFIERLSFDSTSHSRKYRIDGEGFDKYKFPKTVLTNEIRNEYKKIIEYYKKYFYILFKESNEQIDLNWVIENCTYYSSKNKEKIWKYRNRENPIAEAIAHLIWFLTPMKNVEDLMNQISLGKNKDYVFLKDIKSYDDYLYWRKWIIQKYNLKSYKVQSYNNIEHMNTALEIKSITKDLF